MIVVVVVCSSCVVRSLSTRRKEPRRLSESLYRAIEESLELPCLVKEEALVCFAFKEFFLSPLDTHSFSLSVALFC